MTAKNPEPLEHATSLTEQITLGVPPAQDDLNQIWDAGDDALRQLAAAGYSPAEFLPDDEASQLNFTVWGADFARRFYRAYAREVRKSLCGADGDLRVRVKTAISAGASSLLSTLAVALAVPLAAVVLLAPIAAVLIIKGIDAFCTMEHLCRVRARCKQPSLKLRMRPGQRSSPFRRPCLKVFPKGRGSSSG